MTSLMEISMKPATLATVHTAPFTIPTNPGPALDPITITAASSATKISDIYKVYELQSKIYSEFIEAERISVKLALDSMAEIYYKALKHEHAGYAKVTLRQLLDHLVTTNSVIDQFELEKKPREVDSKV